MHIAVDARELGGRPTGVGRYLTELLDHWATSTDAKRHRWLFYAHEPLNLPAPFSTALTILPGTGGTRWEQGAFSRALRRNKPDVLFAPGYTAPLTSPAPVALTIHDVSFFAHPEWFSLREGFRRRTLTAWSARRARIVLTDSEFSRTEIARHIGLPEERIRVIHLGLTRKSPPANSDQREPMVLFVGSIFRRRHVETLIDVFVRRIAPQVPGSRLEIVGENRLYPATDLAASLDRCAPEIASRVTLRSYVDEQTLADLYRCATVFAFLSEYEGFGFTPLEALAAGVPPVVLDTPISREIYGPAARYVDTTSLQESLAEALNQLLTDPAARAGLLSHADAVLGRYDWSRTAERTLRALEEAAGV